MLPHHAPIVMSREVSMSTQFSSGHGTGNTKSATTDAVSAALDRLGGATPKLGFILTSPEHNLKVALAAAASAAPGTEFVAAGATRCFTEDGALAEGVAVGLLASDQMSPLVGS